jgi:hypothetical protein
MNAMVEKLMRVEREITEDREAACAVRISNAERCPWYLGPDCLSPLDFPK